jgi:hypothetical protein
VRHMTRHIKISFTDKILLICLDGPGVDLLSFLEFISLLSTRKVVQLLLPINKPKTLGALKV